MMAPSRRAAIAGRVMLHSQTLLSRLVWMTFSNTSSGVSIEGPKEGLVAAFPTTMSILPHFDTVASTSACSSCL